MKETVFNRKSILISLILTIAVFLINFFIPSQVNGFAEPGFNTKVENIFENTTSKVVFATRYQGSEFRRRPFMIEFQRFMQEKMNVPVQAAFNLLNFLVLFFVFLLLPKLAIVLGQRKEDVGYSQGLLFVSLPIVFAFFGNMCTYDDIIQYLFLILFLINLFSGKPIVAFVFFTLACICRETSFLFYFIVMFYVVHEDRFTTISLAKLFLWAGAIIIYYGYLTTYLSEELLLETKLYLEKDRFSHWKNNFIEFDHFRESTTLLFVMTGGYLYLLQRKAFYDDDFSRYWKKILVVFIVINCVVVSTSALIREARLLLLPLLLVIPFVQTEFKTTLVKIKAFFHERIFINYLIVLTLSVLVAFVWFTPNTNGTGYLYKGYVFLYCMMYFSLFFTKTNYQYQEPYE